MRVLRSPSVARTSRFGPSVRVVAALLGSLLGACGDFLGPAPRLILVGLDGADWRDLAPLVDEGRVPHLRSLIARGTASPLATFEPTQSPVIWTTIATGRPMEEHGITGFEWTDPESGETRLFTSNMRRTPSLWRILSESSVRVGVIGWWVTWPAEPVDGFLVSSYTYPKARLKKGTVLEGIPNQVWPPELEGALGDLVREGEARAIETVFPTVFPDLDAHERVPWLTKIVLDSKWTCVSDEIFTAAAERFSPAMRPEFLTVYLGGIDVVGHRFLRFHRPDEYPPLETPPELADALAAVVPRTYESVDALVGRILALAGDDTAVLVVSDHGMDVERDSQDEFLLARSGQHRHAPAGILIAAGGPFRRGGWAELDVGVLDVLPTVLRALGAPIAEDLPGRVVEELFESRFLETHPPRTVPTYESRPPPDADRPLESPADDELKERLRALGYIR